MEIRHLKLVKAVAAEGSLTRAAAQLFLSQSALSHQLKELESELGAQLFVRAKKKMLPTQAGKRLLQTADKVLMELGRAHCDIDRLMREDAGKLRFTTGCYTCYHWLSPVLKAYKDKYPKVEIEVIPEATYDSFDYLLEGKVDMVFISDWIDNPHLDFYPLFEDELVAVVSPDHPWADRKRIFPRDFEQETLIMYDVPDQNSTILSEFFKPSGSWPRQVLRLKLTEAVLEMTKAEMGAFILAQWAIQPYLERGEVVSIPLNKKIRRTWFVVSLKNMEQPAFMEEFVRQLEVALASEKSIIGMS